MHVYQVGKPYISTRSDWPDGVDYNYRSGDHELRIFLRDPSHTEIAAVKTGKARFALAAALNGDVIFLCYKFGNQPWSDATFNYHLVHEDERTVPPVRTPRDRAVLNVILVDGETGLIAGLRVVSFSPEFTWCLEEAIRIQAARPFPGYDAYDGGIARIYNAYNSKAIAEKMAYVSCIGGQN